MFLTSAREEERRARMAQVGGAPHGPTMRNGITRGTVSDDRQAHGLRLDRASKIPRRRYRLAVGGGIWSTEDKSGPFTATRLVLSVPLGLSEKVVASRVLSAERKRLPWWLP